MGWVERSLEWFPKRFLLMSRIAKSPIIVPDSVNVEIKGGLVTVKGPKGDLEHDLGRKWSLCL